MAPVLRKRCIGDRRVGELNVILNLYFLSLILNNKLCFRVKSTIVHYRKTLDYIRILNNMLYNKMYLIIITEIYCAVVLVADKQIKK